VKKRISTDRAPAAVGPYSQGIEAGGFIFVSGQLPATADGELITADPKAAARQALANVRAVLEAAGARMDDVVKVTVYLADIADFGAMNEVYKEFFSEPYPARVAVAVKELPKGAPLEIEAIAVRK